MTIGGLASIPLSYNWIPGATYTVYLEDVNNSIVYHATVVAPS